MRVSGSAVDVRGLEDARMYDLVRVGRLGLMGEIIRLRDNLATVQVYEETAGLVSAKRWKPPARRSWRSWAPGCSPRSSTVCSARSRASRPRRRLPRPRRRRPGAVARAALGIRARRAPGAAVAPGALLGTVRETAAILHRVLVPPGVSGTVAEARAGLLTVEEPAVLLSDGRELTLLQRWPVRLPRPVRRKLDPEVPFVTGQRVLDTLFPAAAGGTAVIPGGFGTGKTVLQQTLAKYAAADIIVYVGCGERGNEMTEVLDRLPRLPTPRPGGRSWTGPSWSPTPRTCRWPRARPRSTRASPSPSTTATWATGWR